MDSIEAALGVVAEHEALIRAGDLDGIVDNAAEDVVVIVPDAPLIEGKASFRELYASLFVFGDWDFRHECHGAEVVADTVVLYGIAKGTLTPSGQEPSSFVNNFLFVFKKQADGKYRHWRLALSPCGRVGAA